MIASSEQRTPGVEERGVEGLDRSKGRDPPRAVTRRNRGAQPEERGKQHRRETSRRHQSSRGERRQDVDQNERGVGGPEAAEYGPDRRQHEDNAEPVQQVIRFPVDVLEQPRAGNETVAGGDEVAESLVMPSPRRMPGRPGERVARETPDER